MKSKSKFINTIIDTIEAESNTPLENKDRIREKLTALFAGYDITKMKKDTISKIEKNGWCRDTTGIILITDKERVMQNMDRIAQEKITSSLMSSYQTRKDLMEIGIETVGDFFLMPPELFRSKWKTNRGEQVRINFLYNLADKYPEFPVYPDEQRGIIDMYKEWISEK